MKDPGRGGKLRLVAEAIGGTMLARRVTDGESLPWYLPRPAGSAAWRERALEVSRAAPTTWLEDSAPALSRTGAALLEPVAAGRGVVVTTGQQPGLFGGPLYTLHKALSALAFARSLETATGVPVRPIFWAATDDADFAEASSTWIRAQSTGARRLRLGQPASDGVPLAEVPLGDVTGLVAALREAARSAPNMEPLGLVARAYNSGVTIGGAYLELLRGLLEPLGMAVLDASVASTMTGARAILRDALRCGENIDRGLAERDAALRAFGAEPQVQRVEGLSLAFMRDPAGRKTRVPLAAATATANSDVVLSPNVLLRPVIERAILPTIAYVAGPGEIAYFAQVSAVAQVLGSEVPLAVPRWSATLIEPDVEEKAARLGVPWRMVADGHSAEAALAGRELGRPVTNAFDQLEADIGDAFSRAGAAIASRLPEFDARIVDGASRSAGFRADRLRRRVLAAAKRRLGSAERDIVAIRGALFPGGIRQERALNFIPLLALYGDEYVSLALASATRHAEALLDGRPLPTDGD
ncbi:MAG: bacillithiol biosynthesis protein BshC [Gemmatimonadota bacterium]